MSISLVEWYPSLMSRRKNVLVQTTCPHALKPTDALGED